MIGVYHTPRASSLRLSGISRVSRRNVRKDTEMSVKAYRNDFYHGYRNLSFPTYEINLRTGKRTDYTTSLFSNTVSRMYHSNNPVVSIGNDIQWRHPSTYRRAAVNFNYERGHRVTSTTAYHYYGHASTVHDDIFTFPLNTYGGDPSTFDNLLAKTETLSRLNQGAVDLGIALVEVKRTAETLADDVIFVAEALKNLRRGRIRLKGKLRRSIIRDSKLSANIYLRYRYGWKPLLTDIYDAIEDIKNGMKRPLIVSAQRRITSRYSDTKPKGQWKVRRQSATTSASCKLVAQLDSTYVARARNAGVLNPQGMVWEVIPYSFVVDWIVPVGNFLEALTAPAGLKFVSGYTGHWCQGEAYGENRAGSGTWVKPIVLKTENFEYNRYRLTTFPWPSPTIKNPLTTDKILAAAALVRQLI